MEKEDALESVLTAKQQARAALTQLQQQWAVAQGHATAAERAAQSMLDEFETLELELQQVGGFSLCFIVLVVQCLERQRSPCWASLKCSSWSCSRWVLSFAFLPHYICSSPPFFVLLRREFCGTLFHKSHLLCMLADGSAAIIVF